ncbi:hypothetical protein EPI10_024523 [Gossypium australe]|uniref:Uncharacterized protein n=1 Tax=Gossypium australe TaxID=47621 RepID=A0A5B6VYR6_9ROSI|nr:hypothetical protein EPI10_024523 [Gossypium australe]
MKINSEIEVFKCDHQLSEEESWKKLGEHCKNIYISNILGSKDTLPLIRTDRINRFKEMDKQKNVEWHDGRWANTDRARRSSICEMTILLDESGNRDILKMGFWPETKSVSRHSNPMS